MKSTEEWVLLLTQHLNLTIDEMIDLEHDINNMRANEWIDTLREGNVPDEIIYDFMGQCCNMKQTVSIDTIEE